MLETQLAVEFADHEYSLGLRTLDFSKAERIFNSPSYGHQSSLPDPRIIPILPANISVLDEGQEIDLMASMSLPKTSEFRIRNQDPEFHVHHIVFNSRFAAININGDDSYEVEDEESLNDASDSLTNNHQECEIVNHVNDDDNVIPNGPTQTLSTIVEDFQDENVSTATTYDHTSFTYQQHQYLQLDHEWLEYIKLFVSCFLNVDNSGRDRNESVNSDDTGIEDDEDNLIETQDFDNEHQFSCIIEDLVKYSAFPIVDVICDFFFDYLSGVFTQVSSTALHRIVLVADALVCGWTPPAILV